MKDPTRRLLLIDRMNELESSGMGCIGCAGTCCTYEANSMLLTPLEAFELFDYLQTNNLLTAELKTKLEDSIKQFRLSPKYKAEKSYLRKTYTCPFFWPSGIGLSIAAGN